MSVQLPPNSTGSLIDTFTTGEGRERQAVIVQGSGNPLKNFQILHTPAAATQATISQAAAAAGVRNVCTLISGSECTVGTAQAAVVQLNLRDGATGAGTILWSMSFSFGTTTMIAVVVPVHIFGTAATAMTLEFSAAGVAASFQSVAMTGYIAS
jgi:hypothetical protein